MYVCMCVFMYVCVYVCVCMYVCVCLCMCMYVCMHVYMYVFLNDINSMPHYTVIMHALDYLNFSFTINFYI